MLSEHDKVRGSDMAAEQMRHDAAQSTEFTPDDVRRMAELLGLPIGQEDLAEVTYRLGALVEELAKLTRLDLHREEPIPLFPVAQSLTGG
jgi:hypothetical protein